MKDRIVGKSNADAKRHYKQRLKKHKKKKAENKKS